VDYVLDLAMPSASQLIGSEELAIDQQKFVKIEILEVVNPERYSLSFELTFRDAAGAETLLGSVGLYPADKPGNFIVATQNKLQTGGSVRVTLRAQNVREGATVRVSMARLRFVNDLSN
jgi:hypothetical protein